MKLCTHEGNYLNISFAYDILYVLIFMHINLPLSPELYLELPTLC